MRRTAATAVALLATACSAAGATPAVRTTDTPAPGEVTAALSAAQDDIFNNRYSAADSAYAQLMTRDPGDPEVLADFALFLNYRHDFAGAAAAAGRAVALAPRNAHVQAILCRVDDWSQHLSGAVSAGRAAVALAPGDALAHLFLAEALADSGDLPGAKREIDSAGRAVSAAPTPFLSAETQRETANLAADSGNLDAQVAALQAALSAQPQWLYRTSELTDAELGAGRPEAARQTLESVIAQSPDDLETLEALGNDALFVGDAKAASAIWSKALALAPADSTLLDINADLSVAARNDINTAVRQFQLALQANPHDLVAAGYLMALARYVQHAPELGVQEITQAVLANLSGMPPQRRPEIPNPDAALAGAAGRALSAVNSVRAAAGQPPVSLDANLSASATSHSFYWLFNNFAGSVAGLGIHQETATLTGFSGAFPWDRAVAFGYPNQRVAEDITHTGDPIAAVHDWVDSVFHRFAILRPDLRVIGYGQAQIGSLTIEDMEFGFNAAPGTAPVLYPNDRQTMVPTSFVDNELPDPVPAGAPRTTGYPVTVTFNAGDSVQVRSFTLAGAGGASLPAYLLTPSQSTENSASLLPVAPLTAGTSYTAHIVATVAGRPLDRSWTFTTTR